jgi:hypothetical protein
LYITFINGTGSGIKFRDLRIALAGKPLATIKDLSQGTSLTRNLTGALGVGNSLLTIQAFGPAGAKLTWKFTAPKIIVTKVTPNSFGPNDKVAVDGQNFSDRPNVTQVYINGKPATIITAHYMRLEFKPPAGLPGGKANLVVGVGTFRSAPVSVTIKAAAEVDGVNMISTAPGQPLVISGKGFSPVTSENEVTIGGYAAQVVSSSPTSINCIIPLGLDSISPVWDLPIKVKVNAVEAKDPDSKGKITIQSRVF